jgi:hypothetical protein
MPLQVCQMMPLQLRGFSQVPSESDGEDTGSPEFDRIKVEGARSRSDMIKNLSLTLLNAQTALDVLDIFTRDILHVDAANPLQPARAIYVEELLIILHFFKAHLRDMHDTDIEALLESDFRVKQLTSMIFERYSQVRNALEFTYQVSAIHSFAFLSRMYNFELTDDHKNALVDALALARPEDNSAILPEVPSLVFMLHALQTEKNHDQITEVVGRLSGLYLDVIGERVDGLACSNLMSGWAEVGFRDEELFSHLADIVVDKAGKEAIFVKGDATAAVNILKAVETLDLEHDELVAVLLEFLLEHFDELKLTWAATLLKTLGTMSVGN